MDIHIRQLRYFMELAKCLNFTKAALNLYIAQPALSQQIQDLEKQLGAKLFERDCRSVSLTSAGKVLLDACPGILNSLDNVKKQILLAHAGLRGNLKVGYIAEFRAILPDILYQFNQLYPDVRLELYLRPLSELKTALHEGDLDAFFSYIGPREFEDHPFQSSPLFYDTLCLAIRKDHPFVLTGCTDHSLLKFETLLALDQKMSSYYTATIQDTCDALGLEVSNTVHSNDMISVLMQVDAGLGFALIPAQLSSFAYKHITFIPVRKRSLECGLIWHKSNRNPALPLLKEILEEKYPHQLDD